MLPSASYKYIYIHTNTYVYDAKYDILSPHYANYKMRENTEIILTPQELHGTTVFYTPTEFGTTLSFRLHNVDFNVHSWMMN